MHLPMVSCTSTNGLEAASVFVVNPHLLWVCESTWVTWCVWGHLYISHFTANTCSGILAVSDASEKLYILCLHMYC